MIEYRRGFEAIFVISFLFLASGTVSLILLTSSYRDLHNSTMLQVIAGLITAVGLVGFVVAEKITRPPINDLFSFIRNKSNKKSGSLLLVCIGDSITHGQCSGNYVSSISDIYFRRKQKQIQVVNAGQNSICSYTILHDRLPCIIKLRPLFVSIMIGTNDIRGLYKRAWESQLIEIWNLPSESFNIQDYKRNLTQIIQQVISETDAKIALFTLPPMGEDLSHEANRFVKKANEIIKDVFLFFEDSKRIKILDLFNAMELTLMKKESSWKSMAVDSFLFASIWMNTLHHIFGVSWNSVSRIVGNELLSDSLHMNEKGAKLANDLILEWLINVNS